MRLGIFTTVHIRDDAALGNLRVLVDSILRHVPRDGYERLVIVDDCSPSAPLLDAYYAHLEHSGKAEVYRMGEGRSPYWAIKYNRGLAEGKLSFGHAIGIMAGFWRLRETGCTHAWIIDGDCVVLRPIDLAAIKALCVRDKVAVVTDYYGGDLDPRVQMVDKTHRIFVETDGREVREDKAALPYRNAWCQYGFPVLFCAVVDLTVEEMFGPLVNAGWVNSRWGTRLLSSHRTAYHPFFRAGEVFHLGFGYTAPNLDMIQDGQTFGNATESVRYGGKDLGCHHAGYLQLVRSTATHIDWLRSVARTPPEAEATFNGSWLVPPPAVQRTRGEFGLRPLREGDAEALSAFDADPKSVRFLSWGPCDLASTRAFLAETARHPWRWFGLQDSNGALLGYGELRPLGEEHGRGPAGISYAVLPKHRRQGHGERILNALIEAAYNQMSYSPLQVAIDVEHEASLRTLKKRHDFETDWILDRTEPYTLRGERRSRHIFLRGLPVGEPITDPVAARRDRETLLFETLGVRR